MIVSLALFSLVWLQSPTSVNVPPPQTKRVGGINRARLNGPALHDSIYKKEKSAFAIFSECLNTIQKKWLPQAYSSAKSVDLDVSLRLKVKPPRGAAKLDPMEFNIQLQGTAVPSGSYHINVIGELGEMELTRTAQKKLMVYHAGKGFSDQNLPRHKNANLQSYRSYGLRYLGALGNQVLKNGGYRLRYVGSGNFEGQLVDRISIAKSRRTRRKKNQPISVNHMWTFWQQGQYEIWIYQASHLPAAIFYSNPDDHIYANIEIEYLDGILPSSFSLQNNSAGFEGSADIQLSYADDKTLNRVSFRLNSSEGHDISFDAALDFQSEIDPVKLRGIPPFGYHKMNQDHLKMLIAAQVMGNILNLQKHGLRLKNFKF